MELKSFYMRLTKAQHDEVTRILEEKHIKQSDALREMARLWVEAHGGTWADEEIKHGDPYRLPHMKHEDRK